MKTGRQDRSTPEPSLTGRADRPGLLLLGLGLLLLILALLPVAPHVWQGTELVRMRHALSLGPDFQVHQDWKPPAWPAEYRTEKGPADPVFSQAIGGLGLADQPDDWARAVVLAQHLLKSGSHVRGGPLRHDLRLTYEGIVSGAGGYCGDFIRVYQALGLAAGLTVRTWAFSFDQFGGHGHIFVEVWNRQLNRWQLLDVFQNYYFTDGNDQPLSALQFRQALIDKSPGLRLHPILPAAAPGWAVEASAWDYFQRGVDAWYVPWGNDVFTYDAAWPVQAFSGVARSAEAMGAWVAGVQPQVRMLATPTNKAAREAMRRLGLTLHLAAVAGAAGLLLMALGLLRRWRNLKQATEALASDWPRACVVGPLPPPAGGMANQCEQLLRLLQSDGAHVQLVRTNAPYQPQWVGRLPFVRAAFRLVPYLIRLWRAIGRAEVVHVFANSGWAWYLLAAPALTIAKLRGVPAIVNYRGGLADEFLSRAPRLVHKQLAGAAARVTPSAFLQRVFARHGLSAEAIPNVVDLMRFPPQPFRDPITAPHLVVTRHLEAIYDIPTALRTFALVRARWPHARLTVAGSGPELDALRRLSDELGLGQAVVFAGRIDNERMALLYAQADLVLNTSRVDNMPISILEALASGLPVVSTRAGGIPDLVEHEHTALLAPVGDHKALAEAVLRLLEDRALAWHLREAGLALAAQYAWPQIRSRWQAAYRDAVQRTAAA